MQEVNNEKLHTHIAQHNSCGLCCVKINNFSATYRHKVALDNVSIHMHCGEITCIIGPNGGGKSTLLKAMINEVKHTGTIEYVNKLDKKVKKPIIGYVPQHIKIDKNVPITVQDLFNMVSKDDKFKEIVSFMEIEGLLNRTVGDLSGGELQKVLITLAMYPFPDILLLDECVANIDKKGIDKVYKLISNLREKYDIAIILVSHNLESMYNYADNVILLDKKVLVEGNPNKVYNSKEFKEIFGAGDTNE